jgi:hypothetical protein
LTENEFVKIIGKCNEADDAVPPIAKVYVKMGGKLNVLPALTLQN